MDPATRRQLAGIALVGGVVAAAALTVSPGAVLARLQGLAASPLLFAGALLAAYLLRPLVAWPISGLSAMVGFVWGAEAFPLALCGAVVTCFPPFLLARRAPTERGLLGWAGTRGVSVRAVAGDTRAVLAARLAPLPADVVSYGAGLSGVPPRAFLVGTAVGEVPWTVAAVLLGASMQTLTLRGGADTLPLAVGAVALAALVVAGPLYRHVAGDPRT